MDIKVEIHPKEITAKVETPNEPIYGCTNDYEKLKNLPKLNGLTIIGDMTETDPTVPEYVKNGYAVNKEDVETIGIVDVKKLWDSIFTN